tara:strand:+ start:807 stop:1145 length:339 start_codon:yes stop_codon:yes gene_type:complete
MLNLKPVLFLMLLWISIIVLLQGCAAPGFLIGSGATTATASSSYQTYKTVTILKTGVDTALAVEGKKTTTDHVVSSLTGKDCKATRVLKEDSLTLYCVDTKPEFLSKSTKGE